ncbi:MAG TPA: hypothetical protein VHE83_00750 [Mycobacteriales bacterium]|nr:hypothetical protein [Mycobacteriales bacterium]
MTDDQPISAADLERLAGLDQADGSPVGEALARSRAALRAWGAEGSPAEPMPADVAGRLDDVLAAAAAEPGNGADVGTVTTLPSLHSPARPNRNRWLAAAAAVVVIAGAGTAIGLASGSPSKKKHPTIASAGPNAAPITLPTAVPVAVSDVNYLTDASVEADMKNLITGKLPPAPDDVAGSVRAAASQAAAGQAVAEDSGGAAAQPPGAVQVPAPNGNAGLNPSASSAATGSAKSSTTTPLSADLFGGAIALCIQQLGQSDSGPAEELIGVERADYQGKRSLFLVYRDPTQLDTVDVFIVGPDCAAAGGDGIRKILVVTLK